MKRAAAELERLRAVDVVKASIARESKQQAADAKAYEIEADARANFEKSNKTTDAAAYKTKMDADAWSHAAIKNAEANLQKKLKEAEGMVAMADAYAKMSQAFGGPAGLLQYSKYLFTMVFYPFSGQTWIMWVATPEGCVKLSFRPFCPEFFYSEMQLLILYVVVMIENGTYVELAKANAAAVNGMQPKISVWNTGSEAGSGGAGGQGSGQDSAATLRNVSNFCSMLLCI